MHVMKYFTRHNLHKAIHIKAVVYIFSMEMINTGIFKKILLCWVSLLIIHH